MKLDYEIAIIGGGPAGSSAAINLAKRGFRVCLFEKKRFPRETICGEFLSKEVIENLKRLELFEKFNLLKPNLINSFRFFNINGKDISADLNFNSYSLKRSTFDLFLLKQAIENGVNVLMPVEVVDIINLKCCYKIVFNSQKREEVIVKNVIAAYGRQNILDKTLNRNFVNKKSGLTGIKFHIHEKYFNNINKNEIQIFAGKNIYCGINAVNDNMVTLCFLEYRNNYTESVKNHLLDLFQENLSFRKLFMFDLRIVIKDSSVLGTGNLYFGRKNIVEDGVYTVGDASGIIAPLSGDGIGMAFESAKIISNIMFEEREYKIDREISREKYVSEWEKLFKKRLFTSKIIQNIILNNYLREAGFKFVKLIPNSLNYFIKTTRT
jgi:flavin-dependent dehydrogenase